MLGVWLRRPAAPMTSTTILDDVSRLVDYFSEDPLASSRVLREIAVSAPENLWALLPAATATAGIRFIIALFLQNGSLIDRLCDPDAFPVSTAIALADQASRVDPQIDMLLARRLVNSDGARRAEASESTGERILAILSAISHGTRLIPILTRVAETFGARVQSKAMLMVGRLARNPGWAQQSFGDLNARVRASVIESLWGAADGIELRNLYRRATKDDHNRVVGNALYGLYLLDDVTVIPRILTLAADTRPVWRSTAAWLIGQCGDARFQETLAGLLRERDGQVRTAAFKAVKHLNQRVAAQRGRGKIEVRLLGVSRNERGQSRAWVRVAGTDGKMLSGIRETAFVLRDGGRPVPSFQVTEQPAPPMLVVAFSLCHQHGYPASHLDAMRKAVLHCLPAKRDGDLWGVATTQGIAGTGTFRWQGREMEEAKQVATAPPLTDNADELRQRLGAEPPTLTSDTVAADTLESILRTPVPTRAARRIVLLADGTPLTEEQTTRLIPLIANSRTMIHVVQLGPPGPDHGFERLAGETGGSFDRTDTAGIGAVLERLCVSWLSHYEVAFDGPAHELGVQVYADAGFGEHHL